MNKKFFAGAILSSALIFLAESAQAALVKCTGHNNECTICDFFAMVANTIGYTLKFVVPPAALLVVAAGGLIMILKKGQPEVIERVKNIFKAALVGALIAYCGWVVVSVSLASLGSFNKDSWYKFEMNCSYCGDGFVQGGEECEPAENVEECVARGAGNSEECASIIASCSKECKIKPGCGTRNPLHDKIGVGCWLTNNPADARYCDRGKYVCNEESGEITCEPLETQQKDECCVDGGRALVAAGFQFNIVRAQQYLEARDGAEGERARRGLGQSFTCDDVCATRGEVCIGVGLTNVAVNRCISIKHHAQGKCELSINQQSNNCHATFYVSRADCAETTSPCQPAFEPCTTISEAGRPSSDETEYVKFSVHETACYCK
jgi:hypothetical protein